MVISYLGKQFFKISQGDLTLAFNPISKDSKFKDNISRFGSNVVFVTANHKDFNGVDSVTFGETVPFVVSGPVDYEVKEIFVNGVATETEMDKKKIINTIYSLDLDGIKLCFLGSLNGEIKSDVREAIGNPDILFVPIGGEGVLSAKDAYKLSLSLEPKIIIPMDYGEDRAKDSLKTFLKEEGSDKVEAMDKIVIKRKDLEGKECEIVVLKY